MSRARDLSRLSNSQAFSVDSNFNVGINTDNPQVELDVSGNANISGNISVGGTITYDDVTNIDSIGIITARSDVSIADRIIHTGDTDTTIRFPADDTITGETAGFERVRIDSSGNVGIGQTSPVAPIDITTANGRFLVREDQSDLCLDSVTTSNDAFENLRIRGTNLIFQNGGDERMRIDSSGKVGIGTTSPGDYSGATTQLSIAASGSSGLNIVSGTTSTGIIRFADGTSGDAAYRGRVEYMHDVDALMFGTAGSERLRITSDGKLGVGTSSPSSFYANKVVIDTGAAAQDGLTIKTGTTAQAMIAFADGTSGSDRYSGYIDYNHNTNVLSFGTNGGSERLRIDSSGNVGIGVTGPSSILNVAKDSSDTAHTGTNYPATESGILVDNLEGTTGTYAAVTMRASNGSTTQAGSILAKSVGSGFSPEIHFSQRTGSGVNQSRMIIDSSGRLLVGTSSSRSNSFGNAAIEQLETTGADASLQVTRNSNNTAPPIVSFGKTRSGSLGGVTVVNSGDQLGAVNFEGADGSALVMGAQIKAEVDGTPGSNDMPGRLVFSTTADGDSSPTERMRIGNGGQISGYSATGWDGFSAAMQDAAGTTRRAFLGRYGATATDTGTVSFAVYTNGNVQNTNNSYGALSDIKLKENIVNASSQWDDLKAIQVRNYNFKEGQTHTQLGVIAQEIELVSPGLVTESPDRDEEGNDLGTVTKSVNYSVLYMKAVKALQEAMERIETLEQRLSDAGIA